MRVLSLGDLQQEIVGQHKEIRARIRGLTTNALRAELPWALRALRLLLLRFAARFDEHLGFEERELAPRIRALDAWGSVREAALLAEHREQRRRLERVCALADDPFAAGAPDLAKAVLTLASALLEDMAHEERVLAELASIDENGHIDQMTG